MSAVTPIPRCHAARPRWGAARHPGGGYPQPIEVRIATRRGGHQRLGCRARDDPRLGAKFPRWFLGLQAAEWPRPPTRSLSPAPAPCRRPLLAGRSPPHLLDAVTDVLVNL